jgi:phospholipid/cholesterol/gamma-HCH transport system substrate-binding protein
MPAAAVVDMAVSVRRRAAAAAVCVLVLTGCQWGGVSSLPLPGGPNLGPHPYRVVIEFTNVLDLVPYSLVKVDDVTVGKVVRVQLVGWHAQVTCMINGDAHLPANAVAKIEQTSLLGEKFVALSPPAGQPPSGTLRDGSLIPLKRTAEDVQIEQVLSALSLLVNEGGLENIATITSELNAALHGNEGEVRDVIKQLSDAVGTLNAQRGTIIRAIRNLGLLTAKLAAQRTTLARALDQITPAVKLLAQQRAQLTRLLVAIRKLGVVTDRVIRESSADFLANLRSLEPIAANLAKTGAQLPQALELMITFPFPKTATNAIRGDYVNLNVRLDMNATSLLRNFLSGTALSGLPRSAGPLTAPPLITQPKPPLGTIPPVLGGGNPVTGGKGGAPGGSSSGGQQGGPGGILGLLTGGLG